MHSILLKGVKNFKVLFRFANGNCSLTENNIFVDILVNACIIIKYERSLFFACVRYSEYLDIPADFGLAFVTHSYYFNYCFLKSYFLVFIAISLGTIFRVRHECYLLSYNKYHAGSVLVVLKRIICHHST